jgi:hypothetical protein
MTTAHDLVQQIRDLINAPRKRALLLKDRAVWGKLCSSLDVVGDTELALEAYLARKTSPQDTGELYLLMYGVLQVLYVQQDAVKHLAEALGIPYARSAELSAVRQVRNDATGHPTKSRYGKAFNFISQITMFSGGFQMITVNANGTDEIKQVDVPNLVGRQRPAIATALQEILTKLKEQETTHRKEFRGTKLAEFFPSTLGHTHEKISEAIIDGPGKHAFGAAMLESVTRRIESFRAELEKRGMLERDGAAAYSIDELKRPSARLRDYFAAEDPGMTAADAEVFHFFIREKVKGLCSLAEEIDTEYGEDA